LVKHESVERQLLYCTTPPVWWPSNWRSEFDSRSRLRAKALLPCTFDFANISFDSLCRHVSISTDLPVLIDNDDVAREESMMDFSASLILDDLPLRSALRSAFERFDLTPILYPDRIVLTSKDGTKGHPVWMEPHLR